MLAVVLCFGFAILVIVTVISNLVVAMLIFSLLFCWPDMFSHGFCFALRVMFCQVHILSHDFGHIVISWPRVVSCSYYWLCGFGHILGHAHIFSHAIGYIVLVTLIFLAT